ncbi:MAG: undecaprenyl-phosphate glucose phosphotransferase [Parvibaculaceae bacterium]
MRQPVAAEGRSRFVDPEIVQRLLKTADFALLFAGAVVLYLGASGPSRPDMPSLIGFLALATALASMLALRGLGLYEIPALANLRRAVAGSLATTVLVGAVVLVLADTLLFPIERAWLTGWFALALAHFSLTRLAVAAYVLPKVRTGAFRQRIAIVGGGKAAEEAIHLLETSPHISVEIVGLFDDRNDERSPDSVRAHAKIGAIADLARFAREHRVDLVIVAIPLSAETRLLQVLKRLWELPVDIRISGQASKLKLSPRAYTSLGKLPLLSVFDRPLTGWASFLKGLLDRVLAGLLIVALSPVLALTALAVKLDSKGPAIFRQRRYGFNNELIEVFKFRSMYTDQSDATAAKLVTKGDPRVTRVGRFIRKTSLDELPQLFNVLKGDLSLVGPRPHATQAKAAEALYEQVVDGYFARHKVKPGITGWAQVSGWRGETDTTEKISERVRHDLEYIDNWSLAFDLYILLKTPLALMKSENAY